MEPEPEVGRTCPSPAEQARTVLARGASAEVVWLDPEPGEELARHTVSTVALEMSMVEAGSPGRGRPVLVELAEASPLPVRDRIRARLRVCGFGVVEPGSPTRLLLRPSAVQLVRGDDVEPVCLAELAEATVDPFAEVEWALLSHLSAAHPELVELLTRLVEPAHLQGVVRVSPLGLDRYGVTLRLEHARRHRDVRLAYPAPVDSISQLRSGMRDLASRAAGRGCRTRLSPHASP